VGSVEVGWLEELRGGKAHRRSPFDFAQGRLSASLGMTKWRAALILSSCYGGMEGSYRCPAAVYEMVEGAEGKQIQTGASLSAACPTQAQNRA
jgi:hypothetical protein